MSAVKRVNSKRDNTSSRPRNIPVICNSGINQNLMRLYKYLCQIRVVLSIRFRCCNRCYILSKDSGNPCFSDIREMYLPNYGIYSNEFLGHKFEEWNRVTSIPEILYRDETNSSVSIPNINRRRQVNFI